MLGSRKKSKESKKKVSDNKEIISEHLEKGFLLTKVIIEIAGAPEDHVVTTLKNYIDKIKTVKDIKVLKTDFSKVDKKDKFFHQFVEIEMLVRDASTLVFFCFDYMPSSIEIIEPSKLYYKSSDFASFFNDFQARLHNVDLMVKDMTAKNKLLLRNGNSLLRNLVILTLSYKGDLEMDKLSKRVGIPEKQLKPFIDQMEKDNWIKKQKNKYSVVKKID